MDEGFSQDIMLFISSISGIGISYLIGLLWRYHRVKMEALRLLTFKNIDGELDALENLISKLNIRLQAKIEELEKLKNKEPEVKYLVDRLIIIKDMQRIYGKGIHYYDDGRRPSFLKNLHSDGLSLFGDGPESFQHKINDYLDKEK